MLKVQMTKDLRKLEELERELPKRLRATMRDISEDVVTDIKQSINTPYPPASRVGEAPHKRTGILQQSIDAEQTRAPSGRFDFGYEVKVDAYYAAYLEPIDPQASGPTGKGAGHLNRPFLAPALDRASTRIVPYAIRHKVARP